MRWGWSTTDSRAVYPDINATKSFNDLLDSCLHRHFIGNVHPEYLHLHVWELRL